MREIECRSVNPDILFSADYDTEELGLHSKSDFRAITY